MREVNRRKTTIVRLCNQKTGKRRSPRLLANQLTLVSSLTKLMMTQRSIVGILRVKSLKSESTIPIGFKLEKDLIPPNLVPLSMHPDNVVEIQIDGFQAIPAMIVATGDDSKELLEAYRCFYENCKTFRIPRLSTRINYWIPLNNIIVSTAPCNSLRSITQATFEAFFKRVDILKVTEAQILQGSNSSDPVVVNLGSQEHQILPILNASEIKQEPEDFSTSLPRSPRASCSSAVPSNEFDYGKLNSHLDEIQKEIRGLKFDVSQIPEENELSPHFKRIAKVFDSLIKTLNLIRDYSMKRFTDEEAESEQSIGNQTNYFIGKDKTAESGSRTLIEGIFPVFTSKYKKVIKSFPSRIEERDPATIMTSFVKYCFPNHWIANMTLRGYGGKRSLITQWGYQDPLSCPVKGNFVGGLGEQRLRALMDHVLRKCGRNSYDIATEKLLISNISKALHYNRTKIKREDESPRKSSVPKDDIVLSSDEVDEDEEDESFNVRPKRSRRRLVIDDEESNEGFDWDNLKKAYDSRSHVNPLDFLPSIENESQLEQESLDLRKDQRNVKNETNEEGKDIQEFNDLSGLTQVIPLSFTNLQNVTSTPIKDSLSESEKAEKEDQEILGQDSGIGISEKGSKRNLVEEEIQTSQNASKKQRSDTESQVKLSESAEDSSNASIYSTKTESDSKESNQGEGKQKESNQEDSNIESQVEPEKKDSKSETEAELNQQDSNSAIEVGTNKQGSKSDADVESNSQSIPLALTAQNSISDDQLLSILAARQKDPKFAQILASLEKRI